MPAKPNILYLMCDQLRHDCVAALGNPRISTPNLDRLVRRGASFTNAYTPAPVCVAARYSVRTGRDPHTTCSFSNRPPRALGGLPESMEGRCGPYLARRLRELGYRTYGVGKFHTTPDGGEDLGYDVTLRTEEIYGTPEERSRDAYGSFLMGSHPEYAHVEQPHGERTEMYYVPQTAALPKELTVESFVADEVVGLINEPDPLGRPWFAFASFIGPHPPCAPPIPYNRMYNPDRMAGPICGDHATDHMDAFLPWMDYLIWADDLSDLSARTLKSRYYGEVSYIDSCIGRILDAVDSMPDPDGTLICLFSDHGDHLGDHHAWQKEGWFEQSARVPFLVSWPGGGIKGGSLDGSLVTLTDLFGIATSAAGALEARDGVDVLGTLAGRARPRESLFACYGDPGTDLFKVMLREGDYKYIYFSNGGLCQLFDLAADPHELTNLAGGLPDVAGRMHECAVMQADRPSLSAAFDGPGLRRFPLTHRPYRRINQMAYDLGVHGFSFLP